MSRPYVEKPKGEPKVKAEGDCDDCGRPTNGFLSEDAVAKGGNNRDPGDLVCHGCNVRRTMMVKQVDDLPNSLQVIRAKRFRT